MMTKEELFKKYGINETHNVWESIDSWMSVEIYRIMHGGNLPPQEDTSIKWVLDFLDKMKIDRAWLTKEIMIRNDWGNIFLTAKRMVYKFSESILEDKDIGFKKMMNPKVEWKTGEKVRIRHQWWACRGEPTPCTVISYNDFENSAVIRDDINGRTSSIHAGSLISEKNYKPLNKLI